MGISEEKYQYNHSPVGKAQNYIRRFHNIVALREAFNLTEDFKKVDAMKVEMEKVVSELTEDFEIVEKKFEEDRIKYEAQVNDKLVATMTEIAEILKQFENNYNGNK